MFILFKTVPGNASKNISISAKRISWLLFINCLDLSIMYNVSSPFLTRPANCCISDKIWLSQNAIFILSSSIFTPSFKVAVVNKIFLSSGSLLFFVIYDFKSLHSSPNSFLCVFNFAMLVSLMQKATSVFWIPLLWASPLSFSVIFFKMDVSPFTNLVAELE